jgi:hypothetical protein
MNLNSSAAQPGHLTADIRQLYKRNILNSLGCAIAALPIDLSKLCANSSTNIGRQVVAPESSYAQR